MKPTMYFLINSIDLIRGGLTKASLKQASFFADQGYDTYMLTFNHNARYPEIRKKLLELNKIHQDVKILNFFEYLEGNTVPVINDTVPQEFDLYDNLSGSTLDKRKGHNAYRVYKNGIYEKYISLNEDNSLNFIDYFNENRYRTKRELYSNSENLRGVLYMDYQYNKPRQSIYYRENGIAYLSIWEEAKNQTVKRINFFNENGELKKASIEDLDHHKKQWIKNLIQEDEVPILISDTRSTDPLLVDLEYEKARKIWRLHSSHLEDNNDQLTITEPVKKGFEHIDCFDAALVLTEEQKDDINDTFGVKDNLYVVPHYYENLSNSFLAKVKRKIVKDYKTAVIVSRFSELKRTEDAIKAFEKVVKVKPDAQLEIWGFGNQETKLKALTRDLNLENNVFLKGFTNETAKVYEKGLFSILTSKKEGFALSILESMANQTPVISYDIKYGPRDLIIDGENGMIVENGDINLLSNAMIEAFNNPEEMVKMGEKAFDYVSEKFGEDMYNRKWMEIINLVINSDSKNIQI